uniref:Rho-GAP domain-containing protein n=1 Tax=Periophthalmus magnuspinnatus TaxID=409849 RepID=A0A3B4AQE5_9GOBI
MQNYDTHLPQVLSNQTKLEVNKYEKICTLFGLCALFLNVLFVFQRMKSQSYRRQSAPSLVITKALTRESFVVSICPETSAFVQSFLSGFDRSFLLHGHAQLKTGLQTQDRHLFLFTDVLVIAKAKSSNQFKQKAQVSLCEMWTAGCLDEVCEGTTYPERSFVLGWPTSNCVAVFGSAEQKEKWLTLLKSRIKEEKENEEPKTIPLRVYGKGINTFAVVSCFYVLRQLNIGVWTIKKTLLGRLCIYYYFMFSFLVDFSQKSFKRRRSLITWAFWRGPAQLTDPSLSGAPRGCLFGQPLSSVCIENTLPKPVMDMLTFLYHEGCWTRGIFRRPAGARAVRELRDSLDSGEIQLPMTRDHVFIIAGVFKEFLRSIPNSLLCCELYEEWLDALEEDDEEEEQVHDVQRILLRLPKENTMLLRHLLAVLHVIQSNASENQMTSLNLSICIAPSLLWPPGAAHSPVVEEEGTKRVQTHFKLKIFTLFVDVTVESWQYPLTDSSYDSLENELDNSSGGSPSLIQRKMDNHHDNHHQPLQGSLDSILTFSDYDQENDTENPSKTTRHYRIEKLGGDSVIYSSKQDYKYVESSPSLGSPSLEARHRPRRRSEPAVTYIRKLQPYNSNTGDDEQLNSQSDLRDESKRRDLGFGMKRLGLEASLSSLSSTPNSPAPNYSSIDSLDSFSFDKSQRQQVKASITDEIPVSIISAPEDYSAKGSPPKDLGTLKSCGNLHPNSWLKKDWRLTLSHKDNLKKEEKTPVSEHGCFA